jgi:outer membrane biogenesis lipoprotein LolB
MWKLTTATASIFLLAACDTTGSIQREQLEQLERAKAEIEAYSEIDDAKCRNYGMPGSSAYDKCRKSAMNARMNARGSGASK